MAKYRADYLGTGGGLYWQSLVSLVAPNHYNIFDMSRFNGPGIRRSFICTAASEDCCWRYLRLLVRRNRATALFALLLLFGSFWMLGDKTIVWRALFPLLPEQVRIGIHPEYTYCIFSLAIAGLAAIGLDALRVANGVRWAIGVVIARGFVPGGVGAADEQSSRSKRNPA